MNEFQTYNFTRHYIPNNDEIKNDNDEDININYADINGKNNNNYYLNNNNKKSEYENNNFDVKKKNSNDFLNNKDNIFGLNFHQDEGDENEVINSLHFIKFIHNKNGDNTYNKNDNYINNMIANSNKINYRNNNAFTNLNNYERKVKNNRNLINNNLKNSLIVDDEPFQISASKYTESNIANDNQSIFSNSRINKYYMNNENKNQNNIDINNNRFSRRENNYNVFDFSPKEYDGNNNEINYVNDINNNNLGIQKIKKNNKDKKNNKNKEKNVNEEQNKLKNDLLLKKNKINAYDDDKANFYTNNPYIIQNKRAGSKKNISFDKSNLNNNAINGDYYKQKKINYKTIQNNNNNYNKTEMNSSFFSNINNGNHQNKIIKHNSYRTYNVNVNNFQKFNSIDYVNNNNAIIKEVNLKKIYSKRQKAELDMVRGCFLYENKVFNFDIRNGLNTINYIKFIKPSEPIISINYKNVQKFYPLIRKQFTQEVTLTNNNSTIDINQNQIYNHNINNNNSHFGKYQSFIDRDNNFKAPYNAYAPNDSIIPNYNNNNFTNKNSVRNNNNQLIDKINKNPIQKNYFKQIENTERNIKLKENKNNNFNNHNNYNVEEVNQNDKNSNNNNNKIDKDGLSNNFKQRIYDWLVDIDIIKDKIIKLDSLPTICINGVLLCDLINRCEGKNEILKGIIRKTSTRSQIQVNINKVMDYLRTLEKFPSRHLWNNVEISKGNSLVIWQLLDDIYNFYGNKVTFKRMHKRLNSKKNLNRTFTMERNNNKSRTIDKFDKKDENFGLNIESYKSKTPLKNPKKFKLNTHHHNSNNNNLINDENSFYINDNDISKYSYTPVIESNRIKNKNKMKSEFDINNKNYNESKNKFDINQYNFNKINKKIKKTYEDNKNLQNIEDNNKLLNFNFKRIAESPNKSNRNNLNHTNDNFNESKMFSIDNEIENDNDYVNYKNKNKNRKNNEDKSFQRNIDISSIYSDKITNVDKNNKSFSGNNRIYIKKNKNYKLGNSSRYHINSNNQSFYSTKPENRIRNKGCFLLFEKSSINKLKEKMGAFQKYNTNEIDTLDFRDI